MYFNMHYVNDDNLNVDYTITNDDTTLSEMFARFVRMTHIMGYQAGSWDTLINELHDNVAFNKNYDIYEWCGDIIFDSEERYLTE